MGGEEIEAIARESHRFPWAEIDGGVLVRAVACLVAHGLAVRLSAVGYGIAARLGVTDARGWSTGWTLGSTGELRRLCEGLCAEGGIEYVVRTLERPVKRR